MILTMKSRSDDGLVLASPEQALWENGKGKGNGLVPELNGIGWCEC